MDLARSHGVNMLVPFRKVEVGVSDHLTLLIPSMSVASHYGCRGSNVGYSCCLLVSKKHMVDHPQPLVPIINHGEPSFATMGFDPLSINIIKIHITHRY